MLLLQSSPSRAAPPAALPTEARALLERAAKYYRTGRPEEAARLLRDGYARYHHPDFVYALGQAERRANHCDAAIAAYTEFLRHDPPLREATHALVNIERCKAELAARRSAPPASRAEAPPRTPPMRPAPPSRPAPAPPRFYRDWAGGVLLATGLAALVGGSLTMGVADGEATKANEAAVYLQREEALARRSNLQVAGAVLLSVGGAAILAGVARYLWVALPGRRAERRRASAPVGITVGVGSLGVRSEW